MDVEGANRAAAQRDVGAQRLTDLGDALSHPLAHGHRLVQVGAVQQHGELVAAEAPDHVVLARLRLKRGRDLGQHHVAERVPERVVASLELVQVGEEQRRGVAACRLPDGPLELFREGANVRERGERVASRELVELSRPFPHLLLQLVACRFDRLLRLLALVHQRGEDQHCHTQGAHGGLQVEQCPVKLAVDERSSGVVGSGDGDQRHQVGGQKREPWSKAERDPHELHEGQVLGGLRQVGVEDAGERDRA